MIVLNDIIVKKIFIRKELEKFLKNKKPEKFQNNKYIGDNIWNECSDIAVDEILKYTRDFVLKNPNGKYFNIYKNEEKTLLLLKKSFISKNESVCFPERFSEDIVKRNVRNEINKYYNSDNYSINNLFENLHFENEQKLLLHEKERLYQQLRGDYTEYLLLLSEPNIIPTLKNTKGTDMYLIKDDTIIDLDIKTTRSVWGLENDPKLSIQKLYEEQGSDRFSANPRTYIYYTSNPNINKENIRNQFYKTYDIEFIYEKKLYNVKGTRFIKI